jgi:hypothetical protein
MTHLAIGASRVLLFNPPVYDTRFHWSSWQQPTLLVRLSTHLRHTGTEVKLIDALTQEGAKRLHRERVGMLEIDNVRVPKWRYGLTKSVLLAQLRELSKSTWLPEAVYVECFATFWEGAAEAVRLTRQVFPQARVFLLGSYPKFASEHARRHAEVDDIVTEPVSALAQAHVDLSLYPTCPSFIYLSLGNGLRTADDVASEAAEAAKRGVRHIAFADHAVTSRFPDLFEKVLDKLCDHQLKVRLYAFGNIAPNDIVRRPYLPTLMKKAGYRQICFSDDRDTANNPVSIEQILDDYRGAAALCHAAGFPTREESLSGSVSVGRSGEDLGERARLATLVAHHMGSVILWAYQPLPVECPDIALEHQNGKLFPLRTHNGASYRDYLDLLGLAAVLNTKYRQRTFDFLGDGLTSRLFREGIAKRGWEPDPSVKGTLRLPVIQR